MTSTLLETPPALGARDRRQWPGVAHGWAVLPRGVGVPPLTPRLQVIRACLVLLFVASTSMFLQLVVFSGFQEGASQGRMFDRLRAQFATGTAPVGPVNDKGEELPIGTPIAFMEIPSIGVREVIVQSTTSGALFTGPGHRRDTPFPGQVGSSVIYGRRSTFGGPFSDIDRLKEGDSIRVTTGQGVFEYAVLRVLHEGDVAPSPPAAGVSRLRLVTAAGRAFVPDGVLRVDAELATGAVGGASPTVASIGLSSNERAMAGDPSTLWALALWLQALVLLSLGLVWAWHRWGRAQAWIVFFPPLLLIGLAASGEAARLLPNLL